MCGTKSRQFSALLVLCSLFLFLLPQSFCYADVTLTDKEAEAILNEIEESRTELNEAKNTYEEQKKSYEMQLKETEKKNDNLKTAVTVTGTSSGIFLILMIVFIII